MTFGSMRDVMGKPMSEAALAAVEAVGEKLRGEREDRLAEMYRKGFEADAAACEAAKDDLTGWPPLVEAPDISAAEVGRRLESIREWGTVYQELSNFMKPTNPKDAIGSNKIGAHVVPSVAIMEMALALLDGGCKYGTHTWRVSGVRLTVYTDAIMRHLLAYLEGEEFDQDGAGVVRHLGNVMACCAIILDAQANGMLTDDRPPKMDSGWIEGFNRRAAAVIDNYPDPKQPCAEEVLRNTKQEEDENG